MAINFSPSINIIRDQKKEIDYTPTPNAERVIQNLNDNVTRGIKSFFLIGSFGTGKSAFLLALENQIVHGDDIFHTPISFNGKTKYRSYNLVGDYRSLEETFREELKLKSNKDIIAELNQAYIKLAAKNQGLLIAIDEFGKFLEYAAENRPEKELYIVQKVAEFANDPTKNIIFLTTLHQGFDAYRSKLDEKSRNEWEKVKGRLKEIPFIEPVEQLLHLAAKHLNKKSRITATKEFKDLYKSVIDSRIYPLYNSLNLDIAKQLYPLDILSAGILTKALQKYGQNERSLFTFLKTTEFEEILNRKKIFFSIVDVHDYLVNNFYSLLSSKYNPDYLKWNILKSTMERAEILFEKDFIDKKKLLIAIGLLNIFSPSGAKLNLKFLKKYGELSLGISNVEKEIKLLDKHKLIRFQSFSDSYVLFEGTDIDIDLALVEAEQITDPQIDIVSKLKEYFDFPYISAKASYLEKGTPRFFAFVISNEPITQKPEGEIDGIINLIFGPNNKSNDIKIFSRNTQEAVVYGFYENAKIIKDIIYEIEKANIVLEKYSEDRVVKREVKNLIENLTLELNDLVLESLFYKDSNIQWFFNGKKLEIKSKVDFNKTISLIINSLYSDTPIFNNELINREKLPAAINLARKKLLERLFTDWDKKDLGFEEDKFPPEKTIYLSLLQNTGIHRKVGDTYILDSPTDKTFSKLWTICENYLESTKTVKRSLLDLIERLSDKPFKLKMGFIDFWLPIYLFIKRDDYSLFDGDVYIPYLSNDLIEMIKRNPQNYFIKAFDVKGIKFELFNRYRSLINKSREENLTNNSFIETIRPFLTFYRNLPEYTKNTDRLPRNALALRNAIASARDPEKTFFEDFPSSLNYTTVALYESDKNLEQYIEKLQDSIKELRICFNTLIDRVESNLLQVLGVEGKPFPEYKEYLIGRYKSIKAYLLLPHQKTIYQRMNSSLNDRESWLGSVVQALIGKNLESISDNDEEIIHDKFVNIIQEFDSLSEFANLGIDNQNEEAYKVHINSVNGDTRGAIIRFSKNQIKKAKEIEQKLGSNLSPDKKINQIALLSLLKKEIDNENG